MGRRWLSGQCTRVMIPKIQVRIPSQTADDSYILCQVSEIRPHFPDCQSTLTSATEVRWSTEGQHVLTKAFITVATINKNCLCH